MCGTGQVVRGLGDAITSLQGKLPVLQALRNPALKERHWTKLAAIMATPLVTDPPLTLAQLLDLKVSHYLHLQPHIADVQGKVKLNNHKGPSWGLSSI